MQRLGQVSTEIAERKFSRIIILVPMDLFFERPEEGITKKYGSSTEKASLGKKGQAGDPEDQPALLDPFYRSPGAYPH